MNIILEKNIDDHEILRPTENSVRVALAQSYRGFEITTHWNVISNAYFSISQPNWVNSDSRWKIHSHNFNQCMGVVWVSQNMQHQIAHICPGHWIHDDHGIELLEHHIWILKTYFKRWAEAAINKNGIYTFGGQNGPGYDAGSKILGDMLESVFWFAPQRLADPSKRGEFQHVLIDQNSIIHGRTKTPYDKKHITTTNKDLGLNLFRFFRRRTDS